MRFRLGVLLASLAAMIALAIGAWLGVFDPPVRRVQPSPAGHRSSLEHHGTNMLVRVVLEPDSISLEDQARLAIEVEGSGTLHWPEIGETLGDLRVAGRTSLERLAGRDASHHERLVLTLEAFLPGAYDIPALEFSTSRGGSCSTSPVRLEVLGTLSGAETLAPARGPLDAPTQPSLGALAAAGTLGLGGLAMLGWWRRDLLRARAARASEPLSIEARLSLLDALLSGSREIGADARATLDRSRPIDHGLSLAARASIDRARFSPEPTSIEQADQLLLAMRAELAALSPGPASPPAPSPGGSPA